MFSFQLVENFYDRYGGGSIESGKFSLPRELSEYLSLLSEKTGKALPVSVNLDEAEKLVRGLIL